MNTDAQFSDAVKEKVARTRDYENRQLIPKAIQSAGLAQTLLAEIIDFMRPGMYESEVRNFALNLFSTRGIERTWHPPYVRFADHTLLTFQHKAKDDYVLGESDIAFVDIGIVKDGVEGDAGITRVFGNNPRYLYVQQASQQIFNDAREYWRHENPNGIELYDYIHRLAEQLNVVFSLDPAGHLIGEFPHRGWKKGINHFPEKLAPACWILEIQICDSEQRFGAFYESLLY